MTLRGYLYIFLALLISANIFLWLALERKDETLLVAFLDVGQGDSIYIKSPTGNDVLVDGGPLGGNLLRELGKVMSFGDRKIDLIVATHPDADHVGGLPAVLDRLEVSAVMEPGVIQTKPTQIYSIFENKVQDETAQRIIARRGQVVDIGGGAVLTILYPDKDVTHLRDTNEGSIIAKVSYRDICFILTADAPKEVEHKILVNGDNIDCEVLKAGHHGSRTSSSASFISAVSPEYTIISAGKNNRYGHPHREVIEILRKASTTIISTAEVGTIAFRSDGISVLKK